MDGINGQTRFAGRWWLPGNAANALHGTLTVGDGRAEVAITDQVTPEWYGGLRDAVGMVLTVPAVHGEAEGIDFTLLGCDIPIETAAEVRIAFDADAVLRGVHIRDASDAAFDGVDFVIQNLAGYAGASGLKVAKDGTVLSPAHAPVDAAVGDGLTASLEWTMGRSSSHSSTGRTIIITESAKIFVRSSRLLSVDDVRRIERRLRDLVTFITGVASLATTRALVGPAPSSGEEASDKQRRTSFLSEMTSFKVRDSGRAVDGVLNAADIPWVDMAPRWFDLYDEFRPILGTLVGDRYLDAHFIENRALHLVIAVEQAYRVLGLQETFLSENKLSKARKAIRAAVENASDVPDFLPPLLAELLAQLHNRVTLDVRLGGIVEYVGEAAITLMGGSTGVDWWIQAARRSRNDLGHTGKTDKFGVGALGTIARATEGLLELVIAKKLGAGDALLQRVVERRHWRVAASISGTLQPLPETTEG